MNFPILLYHHIKENSQGQDFSVSIETFDRQMKYLFENGYKSISFDSIENCQTGNPFIITFDDGYEDIYLNALPVLKKYGFTATVFLVVDCIGKTNMWDNTPEKILSYSQINELIKNGFSIGSHTLTHPHLTKLSTEECWKEIKDSKTVLEDKFKVEVKTFSYPYNEFNDKIKNAVENSGYGFACAISTKSRSVLKDRFAIRRIYVKTSDTMFDFKRKVSKLYLAYRGVMGK